MLHTARLRDLMALRVFVDTPLDICCSRRITRDLSQRGRTQESVIQQFEATVRPMYVQYIEPSKQYADILIPGDTAHSETMDHLTAKIHGMFHLE